MKILFTWITIDMKIHYQLTQYQHFDTNHTGICHPWDNFGSDLWGHTTKSVQTGTNTNPLTTPVTFANTKNCGELLDACEVSFKEGKGNKE